MVRKSLVLVVLLGLSSLALAQYGPGGSGGGQGGGPGNGQGMGPGRGQGPGMGGMGGGPLQACQGDVQKLCKDIQPGESRIVNCLKEHRDQISETCRNSLKQAMGSRPGGQGGQGGQGLGPGFGPGAQGGPGAGQGRPRWPREE